MATAILFNSCEHCERPHVHDGADFSPDRFCAACSGDRRMLAAAALKSRPISRAEIKASGKYLERADARG
ncbi:hypothetical protein GOC53_28195 [Sinorhizobium medicae]|nr:hypothetical protein [Sinorhizobium medicae]MDX0533009.1 hypothetical protein [Sinorhizobium medicae]MDX0997691.1 hypothetical protein [Sinorhizobium medicae]MDX1181532.1 hypothetical protein [Sinorhizobium medicae]